MERVCIPKQVTATFKPLKRTFGYRIRRMDLEGSPEIPALAEYVKLMDRTQLSGKRRRVRVHHGACDGSSLRERN